MAKLFDYQKYSDVVDSSFTKSFRSGGIVNRLQQSISSKTYNFARNQNLSSSEKLIQENYSPIYDIQIEARKLGGLAGDYQWLRLAEIERIVNQYKPKSVCEFGSGTSSAMFAALMKGKGEFVTVEESEYWQERMLESVGELKNDMTSLRKDRICELRDGESVTYYDIDHNQKYDLVYVDGPYAEPLDNDQDVVVKDPDGIMPNIDVELFWENGHFPQVILIDGRRPSVRRLINKSGGQYHVILASKLLVKVGLFKPFEYNYHTIMIKKERE